MVNLDYFYGSEGEQYRFYQIPAILLEDEEYKKISDTAKLLYGILLSRLALSKKNNWIEKETNRVYILYNRNDIAQKMGKSPNTISNAMNQLLEVGLIKRKRQGQGKADMLYVMNFSSGEHKKTVNTYCEEEKEVPASPDQLHSFYEDKEEKVYTIELTTKNEYTIPDIWGLKVGRKFLDTGEIESHFEEQQFFEIRKRATLLEYPHTVILMEQDFAERKVIDYYVIYDIKESSKYKPTIVNEYVDNIILGTGEYKCEYEILLSCGDATRRLVIPVRTINMPMYDFITSIEDEIEDVMDRSSEENIFSNIIIDTGDYFLLDMFDEYGRTYKVEITSVYDFIKMIVSIRQIRCEFFPYEKK